MLLWESLLSALTSIRSNKLRSFLTVLGIIIGVGSVMTMMSLVEGARRNVLKQFQSLGASTIFVVFAPEEKTLRKRGVFKGLTMADAEAIRRGCDLVSLVCPERSFWDRVVRGNREHRGKVTGVNAEIQQLISVDVEKGRGLTPEDVSESRSVCVLGKAVADELFGEENPIGKEVRVRGVRLLVVGVLAKQGRILGQDLDANVHVPLTVVLKRLAGGQVLSSIEAKAVSPELVEEAADQIWTILRLHHQDVKDFIVDTPATMVSAVNKTLNLFSLVLGGVGGLAMLVAGIGIMNIMLVSVTERTREIGIRKAVGATQQAILTQFLTEAGALSGGGGVLGVAFGYSLAWAVGAIMKDKMPTNVPVWAAVLAFSVSVAVGVFFGWFPAWKAARLDPIEALRTE